MSERKTYFVDVVIPVPIRKLFTYRIPFELNGMVKSGMRVVVPFGRSKLYTGIAIHIHENIPENYQAKFIEFLLDDSPIITHQQYQFWSWISEYYMAPIGDVMNIALPANFKLASETKITFHPDFEIGNLEFSERQQQIIEALEVKECLDLKEISEIIGIKTIQPIIKEMIDKKILISLEEMSYKYIPKTAIFYFFNEPFQNEEKLNELIEELDIRKSKEKQVNAILCMLQLGGSKNNFKEPVLRKLLEEKGVSISSLQTLEKMGVLRSERLKIERFDIDEKEGQKKQLSEIQQTALNEVRNQFKDKDVCLLHGVTGSGKTEIYVDLIEEQIQLGNQVLFLLPEIALTTQLINRLSAYFGSKVGVYHSKFNQNERVEIWNHVLHNHPERFRIILGARSSVFLPFQKLGLVIVDEEHESSFKQYEPSPRYNARDSSIVLAKFFNAKVLLGSATPSIESYFNAKEGKFGFVELDQRHGGLKLPEVLVADVKKEKKNKTMHSHFSSFLMQKIEETLAKNEQVILFQNRRGYTPSWMCEVCDWIPKCRNCDVSLTYHKHTNTLKCHYCGSATAPMGSCPDCGSNRLSMRGFGTEKIEDEIQVMIPDKKVKRLDLDTTRSKDAYQVIISDFEAQKIDILIGTQMVTKGLDFDKVSLVGVLDADMLLNRPDFRAFERGFQLMTQVAGRSGRKEKQGQVVIQTSRPEHWVIEKVIHHDYKGFYENEIIERENFFYPPFYKIIHVTLKNKDLTLLEAVSRKLAIMLKDIFKERVLGPEFPIIKKIQNLYIKQITLKIEKEVAHRKVKLKLQEIIDEFYTDTNNKSTRIQVDVDPA
jgi:primosomal protein N' (replication factor Y) (superfamily II helicase)